MPGRLLPRASGCASERVAGGPSGVLGPSALDVEVGLDQSAASASLPGIRCPYVSKVTVIEACPIKVCSAFAFTPAAIIIAANEWRHPCGVIRASPPTSHTSSARR